MLSSNLFIGEEIEGKAFAHDLVFVLGNDYYFYGVCCALTIISGAVGPQFFSSPVVDYILHGDIKMVQSFIDNVPNKLMRSKLQQLKQITDEKKFESQVAIFIKELHVDIGYINNNVSFKNKAEFLNSVALHYTITHSLCESNQFIDGLKSFGVLDILRCHPKEARAIFQVTSNKLTAEVVDSLFEFELSPDGSNRNSNEKTILFNWNQLLEDVENGLASSLVHDPLVNAQVEVQITVEAVLAFVTGSSGVPPLGFSPQPSIVFDHVNIVRKLHVSTCSNTLYFPVNEALLPYEQFKKEFLYCMSNSPGFGCV